MQNPYQPPPSTPTAYAPPSGGSYGYGYDPRAAERSRLANETRTWTLVAAIGWFVGFMWVLGPLAWYQSTKIRDGYAMLGEAPPDELRTLRLIGMITTILSAIFAVFTAVMVALYVGFFVTAFRR